jgi:hypothetical protein
MSIINKRPQGINEIKHVIYINLDIRRDRKEHVEKELKKIGFSDITRFPAIKTPNGSFGCSLSHLKILQTAKEYNLPHILIVEDDIQFNDPLLFTEQFNKFLKINSTWDVVLLAGNNGGPFIVENDCSVKVTKCQTTTGYLVHCHYYDTLIDNIKEGLQLLMKEPHKHFLYAIDKYWFKLQEKYNWYLITPLSVIQKPDYSNIEKRVTNYSTAMLILNKF